MTVTVEVYVDQKVACLLNAERTGRLDDTLILHTSLGKDHFISVSGSYQRTCFATSLERLVRMSGPVRKSESLNLRDEDQAANAPEEILRLVNWLMSHATDVEDLFTTPGDLETISALREALDTGAELTPPNAENGPQAMALAVGTCLLELLGSLPEPVVPASLHSRFAQILTKDEAFELLDEFPSASVNVWITVTAFLHYISQQDSGPNTSYAIKLADIFASALLRFPDDDSHPGAQVSPLCKRKFMLYFIA